MRYSCFSMVAELVRVYEPVTEKNGSKTIYADMLVKQPSESRFKIKVACKEGQNSIELLSHKRYKGSLAYLIGTLVIDEDCNHILYADSIMFFSSYRGERIERNDAKFVKMHERTLAWNTNAKDIARYVAIAFEESEMLERSYNILRLSKARTVERYSMEEGDKFELAQRAAIEGDKIAKKIKQLHADRELYLRTLAMSWEIATGSENGKIVANYLRFKGKHKKMAELGYDANQINQAKAEWQAFISDCHLIAQSEFKEVAKALKAKGGPWWMKGPDEIDDD